MPERAASRTAAFVAGLRGSCPWLPKPFQLVEDSYAFKLVPNTYWERLLTVAPSLGRWLLRPGSAAHKAVMVLQLRTKGFDDAVRAEMKKGLAQVLILGAGYDCRALRLAPAAPKQTNFIEIDMPPSQTAKRESLAAAGISTDHVQFIPWDFILKPVKDMPQALSAAGISASKPSVVTWEGVTGYLTEEAISDTVKALAVACAPGSALIFNYSKKLDEVVSPGLFESVRRALWRLCWRVIFPSEEFRFGGWAPGTLAPWLRERGWELESDATYYDLAVRYLKPEHVPLATGSDAPLAASDMQHVIVARRL